jgi:hypothetical protein
MALLGANARLCQRIDVGGLALKSIRAVATDAADGVMIGEEGDVLSGERARTVNMAHSTWLAI